MAEELLDWSTRQGFTTLRAASHAPANSLPYGPISAWLRTANDRNLLSGLSDKWLHETSRILPELMADYPTLPSPDPITESWQRQHLFAALAHAILHQPQPILLFIDDLQWCDIDTLEWLCFFLHFDPQARFLLLGTVRNEEVSDGHPLTALCHDLQREGSFVEINLERLDAVETKTLAEQVTGKPLNDDDAAHLFTETEGVPLFIVELARAGLSLSTLNSSPSGFYEMDADIRLPDKVRTVIERRLANLTSAAYELAGLAAVVGRSFTYDLLAAASNQQESILIQALDELWQQRVIRDQGTSLYDFSHDKIRQVAYHSASPVKRQQWHKQIIKALEAQRAAGQAIEYHQLGTHYEAVGSYLEALDCYQNAAAVAQRIYAHQDVLANLERALAQTKKFNVDGVLISSLHEKRGSVLFTMSEYEEARDAWETAVSYTKNPLDHARLLKQQGEACSAEQNHKAGSSAYHEALNCLESVSNHHHDTLWWQAWLDIQLCRSEMFYFTAQLTEMAAVVEKLQPAIESYGDTKQAYHYRNTQHMLDYRQKRYALDASDVDYVPPSISIGGRNRRSAANRCRSF